jgi:hypothetical protein
MGTPGPAPVVGSRAPFGHVWRDPGRVPPGMPVNLAIIYCDVARKLTNKN